MSQNLDTLLNDETTNYPRTTQLLKKIFGTSKSHQRFLQERFDNNDKELLDSTELLADDVLKLAGDDIDTFCESYHWLCREFVKSELYFRRHNDYEFKTIKEASVHVYHNSEFMRKYMEGLLVSQVFWANHSEVFRFYLNQYLPALKEPFHHLEVGPGHGLFLCRAAQHPLCQSALGWDISESSLNKTAAALRTLNIDNVQLARADVTEAAEEHSSRFDSIVISEVLEHVEDPVGILTNLHKLLSDHGQIFINIPIDSPAPDHIYLWRTPEEVIEFTENCGFRIKSQCLAPVTGYDLAKARKHTVTIQVALVAEKAN